MAACEARRVLFTPICCSVDGMFGSEAEVFLKRASERVCHLNGGNLIAK